MSETINNNDKLSKPAMALGTVFLLFQILFAINNYGPQRIPGLNLIFDERWVGARHADAGNPSEASVSILRMVDVTKDAGMAGYARARINDADPRYLEVMGGGVSVGDFDGDGWEDLFFTGMPSFADTAAARKAGAHTSTLFRNRGDGTFEDVTGPAGLDAIDGYPQGALFFDYDNNGTQDLYVAAYQGGQLFKNRGSDFVDVTGSAGLDLGGRCGELPCFVSSATATDYNRDGFLDLMLVNNVSWDINDAEHRGEHNLFPAFFKPQTSLLFKNNGDGTFTDVAATSGLVNRGGKGLSAVWTDINDDGWPDVYIANDLSHNRLYINNGDGTFSELGAGLNLDEIKSSMGIDAADFDNDGDWDFAVTNLEGTKISLFENSGEYEFFYSTDRAGLTSSGNETGWGIAFADIDMDGFQDLISSNGPVWKGDPSRMANAVYLNMEGRRFVKATGLISDSTGIPSLSRGLAISDFDNSGTPDLVFANIDGSSPQLLANHTDAGNNWLKLRLEGTRSNRDAVGARVTIIRRDGARQMQEIRAGGSYQSNSTKALFFGLGKSVADTVIISWPSGVVQKLHDAGKNRALWIREE